MAFFRQHVGNSKIECDSIEAAHLLAMLYEKGMTLYIPWFYANEAS